MSKLDGNPDYSEALNYSASASEIHGWEREERLIIAEQSTAHATLALAQEQRTANLIAWHAFVDAQGDLPDEAAELSREILKRLGMGEKAHD